MRRPRGLGVPARGPCPHWGYVLKGTIRVHYTDGREETLRLGELYYLRPGHVPVFEEDSAFVEFSPWGSTTRCSRTRDSRHGPRRLASPV